MGGTIVHTWDRPEFDSGWGRGARRAVGLALNLVLFQGLLAVAAGAERVKITWWFDANEFIQNDLIPRFEREHPDIDIEYVVVSGGKQDKILAAFLGGAAPDIFGGWPEERIMLAEKGMALALDGFLRDWQDAGDFFDGAWASARHQGKVYGIPFYLDLRTIIYRKDFFDEAGLESNRPPQTWDELLRAAKKLTRYDDKGNIARAGINVAPNANDFAPYLWQAGGDFLTADLTRANMLPKDSLRALEFYTSLVTEHRVSPAAGVSGSWSDAFWGGSEAMLYANSAVPGRTKQNVPDLYPSVGSGLPPADKQRAVMLHADYFVISATSKHPREAFEVLKFFFRPENLERYAALGNLTPPRKSLMYSNYARQNPVMLQILEAAPYGRTQPPVSNSPAFFQHTGEMLMAALRGEVPPAQAAENFDRKMNATLAESVTR